MIKNVDCWTAKRTDRGVDCIDSMKYDLCSDRNRPGGDDHLAHVWEGVIEYSIVGRMLTQF
jgi:hypothetical protein